MKSRYYTLKIKDENGKEIYAHLRGRHIDSDQKLSVLGVFSTPEDAEKFGDKFVKPDSYTVVPVTVVKIPK